MQSYIEVKKIQPVSNNDLPEQKQIFTYAGEKPNGKHQGAIYTDTNHEYWLLKFVSPVDAVREVVASKLYRSLVGEENAPEVELLQMSDKWIVASKWCDKLDEFNSEAAGLEKMFLASVIIGDVDCIPKNIVTRAGNIFRYDFGAALELTENKQQHHPVLLQFMNLSPAQGLMILTLSAKWIQKNSPQHLMN